MIGIDIEAFNDRIKDLSNDFSNLKDNIQLLEKNKLDLISTHSGSDLGFLTNDLYESLKQIEKEVNNIVNYNDTIKEVIKSYQEQDLRISHDFSNSTPKN